MSKERERCPDCGRPRPVAREICLCGFNFPHDEVYEKERRIKTIYRNLWGNRFKRKNTISFVIIFVGLLLIGNGYRLDYYADHQIGIQDYYKVRQQYLGSSKYYQSARDDLYSEATVYRMVGILIFSMGVIMILSKWLIRPMNPNSAKHQKYDWN